MGRIDECWHCQGGIELTPEKQKLAETLHARGYEWATAATIAVSALESE
jgi:hypothetical protein